MSPHPSPSELLSAKSDLRAEMRSKRGIISEERWLSSSGLIREYLMSHFEATSPSGVALYAALSKRREIDVGALHSSLRARGMRVAYPFMRGLDVGFAWVDDASGLTESRGFAQPPPDAVVVLPGDLDFVVVPALAATLGGVRLGYGAGFYDRLLPHFCPPASAVCVVFHQQLLQNLPTEPHDHRCDGILTEAGWAKRPTSSPLQSEPSAHASEGDRDRRDG